MFASVEQLVYSFGVRPGCDPTTMAHHICATRNLRRSAFTTIRRTIRRIRGATSLQRMCFSITRCRGNERFRSHRHCVSIFQETHYRGRRVRPRCCRRSAVGAPWLARFRDEKCTCLPLRSPRGTSAVDMYIFLGAERHKSRQNRRNWQKYGNLSCMVSDTFTHQ